MPSQGFQLTPEQIARREARKRKRDDAQASGASTPRALPEDDERARIVPRPWLSVREAQAGAERLKVMTWNLLAQCLVRRELFPVSDCLKGAQREHMIYREILSPNADILCLQEVDRLEKLLPIIESGGYEHVYAAGPRKKHGSLIAYRRGVFTKIKTHVLDFDTAQVRDKSGGDADRGCTGLSHVTKNVANIVALKREGTEDGGVIVATTHLFWHPSYSYERARQAGILLREVTKFRDANDCANWPCILAGDFNFSPTDPGYSLLVGAPLLPAQHDLLSQSCVVHLSVDPSVAPTTPKSTSAGADDDDEEGGADPDRVIKNARPARPSDGLLTAAELAALFETPARPRSAYDAGQRLLAHSAEPSIARCGDRLALPPARLGAYEPEWTSYTHYWKTVLDYIFVIDPPDRVSAVVGLLKPHQTSDLDPGIPRKGISGSDHVSLAAELQWQNVP
ncbi:hypothetical protein HETIRDRAFT_99377 [Heterobasidion irregulare TC 32-1]|uniref:Endonuclease/exonuclease/phosphatase domain-containing protein n=1 Tax=Heterobasidion irregulare (strain TC 32-1) TaxID=747525 RepID=W4KPJ1_HETIT|nr:uncharacterized protein HETIRDRAFT_99377 [Heterobasidion irregulare TC 32-1]ETW86966.1 hypothetical protein HETIRDRAFT_99377 [Heterobasidion irregulare TC 32-1]